MARSARAALLNAAGEDVSIEDITLDDPGPDEVVVRIAASGVCHTDLHVKRSGGWGLPFPILLGHEGAGYVEDVGSNVTDLAGGDAVVIAWRAPCGRCAHCRRGDLRRCEAHLRAKRRMHRASDGATLAPTLRTGTFTERTVVHGAQAVKLPDGVPMACACLLACGVSTGAGAPLNTTPVWPGATVAVIGCGGVGLSVVAGATIANASRIVAVDVAPRKLEWARRFGATDVVDASATDAVEAVRELTGGKGVDFAFEATGRAEPVEQMIRMLAFAGTATMVGVQAQGAKATFDLGDPDLGVFENKITLRVNHGGDTIPQSDFPQLARYYLDGKLDLDAMVTKRIALEDVEAAFEDMRAGTVIRSVIVFGGEPETAPRPRVEL
jgi:S-(hydroxymethyl)mycothiol dehydrogenase